VAVLLAAWLAAGSGAAGTARSAPPPGPAGTAALTASPGPAIPAREGDYVVHDFHFASGETLPELRLHYLAVGKPVRGADGHTRNAVLILHGTGGSGRQFFSPQFASVLFGRGALLDTTQYYVILPDGIGHGRSSKPSDGLHARFPKYGYHDIVGAQYRLVTEHLGVDHLRLVMGTSMGGMQTWMWGEAHPDFMDALMPLACLPVEIAGRNRLWRRMIIDAIREDPEWNGGEYVAEPRAGLRTALDLLMIAGSAPLAMQRSFPTGPAADRYLADSFTARFPGLDANDLLYQVDASRDYDPSHDLESITAPIVFVNFADDFINPPELAIADSAIRRVKRGRFVLVPASETTHGHGTHTWAEWWKQYLADLLKESARPPAGAARPEGR